MLSPSELKAVLRTHGLRLTKRLGQHHLIDARMVRRVVEACELSPRDTVVEIGAGLGALTEHLAASGARVIAVEIDRKIAAVLADRLAAQPAVTVVHEDILEFAWDRVGRAVVAGAIPYHITSPILAALSAHRQAVGRAVLVVQQEVAGRLVAHPGTAAYSRLSVLAQYGWEVARLFEVPRSAFFPQPRVDSSCVRLLPRTQPLVAVDDERWFFEVVKAAFAHRRKTLVNGLIGMDRRFSRQQAESAVARLGLPRTIRGETLSLEQLAQLARFLID